jgi:hypothetical protein
MIYLRYRWDRDLFNGSDFRSWAKKFNTLKFEGYECGRYYPTVSISLPEFEQKKHLIQEKNLNQVRGEFTILEQLVYGVRDFCNEIIEG